MRTIRKIIDAPKVNMGGILLEQPLPYRDIDQIDPFLLVHHWKQEQTGGKKQNDLGVGPHPHRGFSPVTFIFQGGVHHQDSRGNNSIVMEGGTQWMNSGMGIVHSERPTKEIAENGGMLEFIQFWVNAPAKHKMDIPSYQPLSAEETTKIISEDGKVKIGLVAGKLLGKSGKIKANSNLITLRIDIEKGGKMRIPLPENFNAFLYQLDGKLKINSSQETSIKQLTWFNNDGEFIELEGIENTRAILLSGEPINEKIATYGPFVMNTQTEIMEAMNDYQKGKMGVLIEEFE
ncbi:MAG: pirin family protein [Marinilabiliales bacterium]|nr:MAG: pirin family protein [Marinilabiliales bacterium]